MAEVHPRDTASERPSSTQWLTQAVQAAGRGWLPFVVGEDQVRKLEELRNNLVQDFSATGEGKKITCGFSYWGVAPTWLWRQASDADNYQLMAESIGKFPSRWRVVAQDLEADFSTYVSLGPGTGEKDVHILRSLTTNSTASAVYIPVDMSAEMLRLSARRAADSFRTNPPYVVGIQLDFSSRSNLKELRRFLDRLTGDQPILFSLLGNTLANYDDDGRLLRELAQHLLRPSKDALLLELATTRDVNESFAKKVVDEYNGSYAFKKWVTSALFQCTDLTPNEGSLVFLPSIEPDQALVLKVLFKNKTGRDITVLLLDHSTLVFPENDTVRIELTRKYADLGIARLINGANLVELRSEALEFEDNPEFGISLTLLARAGTEDPGTKTSIANMVWGESRIEAR